MENIPREIVGEIVYSMDLTTLLEFLKSNKSYHSLRLRPNFWLNYFSRRYPSFNGQVLNLLTLLVSKNLSTLLGIFLESFRLRGKKIPASTFAIFKLKIQEESFDVLNRYLDVIPIDPVKLSDQLMSNLNERFLISLREGEYQLVTQILARLEKKRRDSNNYTPQIPSSLITEAIEKKNIELLKFLYKNNLGIYTFNLLIHEAVERENIDLLDFLFKNGLGIDIFFNKVRYALDKLWYRSIGLSYLTILYKLISRDKSISDLVHPYSDLINRLVNKLSDTLSDESDKGPQPMIFFG